MIEYIVLPKKAKDITGQRFGRLIALGPVGKNDNSNVIWLCVCDCGKITNVVGDYLRKGGTRSCGCLSQESRTVHGMRGTAIYRIWSHIKGRCINQSDNAYASYGGRNIHICDEWRHDFQAFYDYVSALPDYGKKGYSIDRIDNDGDYEPGNVQWSSSKQQSRNRRSNILLTYAGKTQCVADWADELGIKKTVLYDRIYNGWTAEKILTQPIRQRRNI